MSNYNDIPATRKASPKQNQTVAWMLSVYFMAEKGIEATPANKAKFKHRMLATLLNHHGGEDNINHGMIQKYFEQFPVTKVSVGQYKPKKKTKVPADIAKLVKLDETADETVEEKSVKVKATRKKATTKKPATVKAVFDDMVATSYSDKLTEDQKADMLAMLQAKIDALLA